MTIWVCATCGIEHAESDRPPAECAICSDDRQYVPRDGQRWTTHERVRDEHEARVGELEPELYGVEVSPRVGIGHRPLLVRTPGGNLLWEPPGYISESLVDEVRELGGVAAIAASHPHLTGASISWSHAFGAVPVYYAHADRRWIRRPDDAIELWKGSVEVLPGVTLVQTGGHFPGSAVAHWAAGAEGRGALLAGDTIFVSADFASVSFMRSYPNLIPLPERLVRGISAAVEPYAYDRIYGGFAGQSITDGARQVVRASADRYIGWLRDEIRDPDESEI